MEGNWKVTYNENTIGECRIQKSGLYYHFGCSCQWIEEQICRLRMYISGVEVDLGVLIPQNGCLSLYKCIPIKRIPVGEPKFVLFTTGNSQSHDEHFVPVLENTPISCLSKLYNCRLAVRDGQVGLVIKES